MITVCLKPMERSSILGSKYLWEIPIPYVLSTNLSKKIWFIVNYPCVIPLSYDFNCDFRYET